MIGFSIDHSTVLRSSYRKKISSTKVFFSWFSLFFNDIFLYFVNKDKKLIKSYILRFMALFQMTTAE